MDIYVGNLTFDASEDDVREAFATFGAVESVKLIMDRETGRPRGFAFITMTDSGEANTAIESLNGTELLGRELRV
ncbi:MAG: RNA-binding protein, partial [Opitutaceae bacterium]|nr:RNA-binding protein [Opitutaceae bacterium]